MKLVYLSVGIDVTKIESVILVDSMIVTLLEKLARTEDKESGGRYQFNYVSANPCDGCGYNYQSAGCYYAWYTAAA